MANGLGDFDTANIIYGKFTTVAPTTGAPGTLGGSPVLSVYKDNSTTQSTAGVTLTADFDGVTGLNHFAIDTSADATFYSAGSFFDMVITTGTVGGVSAVGYCVGQFTLRETAALKPTVAGRTLDVSATGEAGVDWANVGGQGTTVNLSSTNVDSVDTVFSASVIGTVVVSQVQANAIGPSAFVANSITANALATDAVTEIQTGLATSAQVAAITVPTAINNADALLDRTDAVEVGLTPRQALRVAASALGGKVTGGGTSTNTFRNAVADSKNRIVATVDATGNRTAITYDVT